MKLSFLGAAKNVTGSRYVLDTGDSKILVDCGLYQERKFISRNWDPFPVPPRSLSAILLTHAHLDHCGYLPKLWVAGYRGPVICTEATAEISKVVMMDSGRIQEEDAERKKKRHARENRKGPYPVVPLYTEEDAEKSCDLFKTVKFGEEVDLGGGLSASFHIAGHILGSSMIRMRSGTGADQRTIVFSGDIGRWDKPILKDPTLFEEADYVVCESTYGNRVHSDDAPVPQMMAQEVKKAAELGGKLLVPTFAVERAHEILYVLNELLLQGKIRQIPVFFDSPMAIKVMEIFQRHPESWDEEMTAYERSHQSPFSFPGLKICETRDDSKAINNVRGPAIILAGSGMCTGGRIKHHLAQWISKKDTTVLFTGYQAASTLGREILDGARIIRIHGRMLDVNARIARIYGFSGHADRDELLKWISSMKGIRKVFVTHGEPEAAEELGRTMRAHGIPQVEVPDYGREAALA